jgi:hypothetical protein
MSRERLRQAVTIAVLAAAGALALGMKTAWRRPQPSTAAAQASPQDPIYAMLDAARQGNIAAYLACYTGTMRASLDGAVRESGAAGFARYLRDSNAAIKGVAVNEPERLNGSEARVRVEYVYQDRNEVQNLYLERSGAAWKIARVDGAERAKTLVPYGAPVQ